MRPHELEYAPSDFDTPSDAYGSGYCEFKLREALADLIGIYGREGAQEIASEIIEDTCRKAKH